MGVNAVELFCEVACEFEVLHLIFANRDDVCVVEEDVCGHEYGVVEQACADGLLVVFGGFVFKLRHSLELAQGCDAAEEPCEFGVAGDVRLYEEFAALGFEAAGDVLGHEVSSVLAQVCGFVG